jgi:hypothetical protein
MPRLSCWFIRASLIYLVTGFTLGALLLFHKGIAVQPRFWQLLPPHIEFLLLGWTLQLALGVAFWILPRSLQGLGRGNEALAWVAFILINAGVLLAGVSWMIGAPSFLPLLGRLAEAGGTMAFVMHAWPRVRPLLPR